MENVKVLLKVRHAVLLLVLMQLIVLQLMMTVVHSKKDVLQQVRVVWLQEELAHHIKELQQLVMDMLDQMVNVRELQMQKQLAHQRCVQELMHH